MDAGHPVRAVVVGVDGSRSSLRAVHWAAAEAASRNAPLRIVAACDPGLGGGPARDHANWALAEAVHIAGRARPGLPVQRQLGVGSAVPVLDTHARAALLVVVGDRGTGGGAAGRSLGSVPAALGTRVRCPVVVVRGEYLARDAGRPVVVGVDSGSSAGDAALAFAFEAAAARGVAVVAVRTWWEQLLDTAMDAIEAAERVCLAERLAGWCATYPAVPVLPVVQRDLPAHALTQWSRGAQLVVVGYRGRGWPTGLVLGSVSHTLMHRAHCPVAIVPRGATGTTR